MYHKTGLVFIIALYTVVFLLVAAIEVHGDELLLGTMPSITAPVISTSTQPGFNISVDTSAYHADFKNDSDVLRAVNITISNYTFAFDYAVAQLQWFNSSNNFIGGNVLNPRHTNATAISNFIFYPNAWDGTTLVFEATPDSIKESLVIDSIPSPTFSADYFRYKANLYFTNTLQVCMEGQCYLHPTNIIANTTGQIDFKDTNNNTIFSIPAPIVSDSNGTNASAKWFTTLNNGIATVYLGIPKSFIDTAQFPITLDPTLIIGATIGATDLGVLPAQWVGENFTLPVNATITSIEACIGHVDSVPVSTDMTAGLMATSSGKPSNTYLNNASLWGPTLAVGKCSNLSLPWYNYTAGTMMWYVFKGVGTAGYWHPAWDTNVYNNGSVVATTDSGVNWDLTSYAAYDVVMKINYTVNTAPVLSAISTSIYYVNATNASVSINYSVADADNNLDKCWFNLNSNYKQMLPGCTNFTVMGNSVNLSGDSLQYINISNRSILNGTISMTVSTWIKSNITASTPTFYVIGTRRQLFFGGWALRSIGSGIIFTAGNNSVTTSTLASTTYTDGKWHMYTGTLNYTTISLYVDGVLANSQAYSNMSIWEQSLDIFIGRDTTAGFYFNGTVDEPIIWNRTLSSSEVLALYNNGLGVDEDSINKTGLVLGYHFNEGSGTSAYDFSGNNNTGTLVNSPAWTTGYVSMLRNNYNNTFTLAANDTQNAISSSISTWIITDSISPSLSLTNNTNGILLGNGVNLTIGAANANLNLSSYAVTIYNPDSSVNVQFNLSGNTTYTFNSSAAGQTGYYNITFTATDLALNSNTTSIQVGFGSFSIINEYAWETYNYTSLSSAWGNDTPINNNSVTNMTFVKVTRVIINGICQNCQSSIQYNIASNFTGNYIINGVLDGLNNSINYTVTAGNLNFSTQQLNSTTSPITDYRFQVQVPNALLYFYRPDTGDVLWYAIQPRNISAALHFTIYAQVNTTPSHTFDSATAHPRYNYCLSGADSTTNPPSCTGFDVSVDVTDVNAGANGAINLNYGGPTSARNLRTFAGKFSTFLFRETIEGGGTTGSGTPGGGGPGGGGGFVAPVQQLVNTLNPCANLGANYVAVTNSTGGTSCELRVQQQTLNFKDSPLGTIILVAIVIGSLYIYENDNKKKKSERKKRNDDLFGL